MPTLNDYDKEDEDSGGLSEGFTPAQSSAVGSSNGPKEATPTKQQDDSYVPWSSFVSANQDVSQREAGKLAGQVQGEVTKAQGDLSSAQSGFNNGIDGNYSTPAAKGSKGSSSTPAPSKSAPAAGAEQNQAPATSATDAWAGLSTPTSPATQRTPVPKGAPTGAAIDGSNPFANNTPQSRTPQAQYTPPDTTTGLASAKPQQNQGPGSGFATGHTPQAAQATQQGPLGALLQPQTRAAVAPTNSGAQGLLGFQRSQQLGANVAANGAQGPHDLEASAGQAGWNQLLGDTLTAQQGAHALGSETGVQGLLQQNASGPTNSAFDAALINGQGASQFRDLANKYGGNQLQQGVINAEQASQDRWNQLAGDVKTRQAFDASAKGQPAPTATPDASGKGDSSSTDAYDPSKDDHMDHALDDTRTPVANGWNAIGGELGYMGLTDAPDAGKQWVDKLSDLEAVGGPDSNSFGSQLTAAVGGAEKSLGMTQDQFYGALSKMSGRELGDFWALGVIPQWMNVNGGYGKGVVGGWQSPYIQQTLSYGNDGGMWNALLNFWKQGASTVAAGIPVVGGAVSSGVKAVPVNTQQNKYGKDDNNG